MRAVGGADLDQLRAGARHDLRHAEGAADLDQLAARHDRLAALRQRVEHEQHGGGVVVDDGRVLGAGQLAQQAAHDGRRARRGWPPPRSNSSATALRIAATAASIACLGDERAAEIGVQHRAGEIVDRLEARRGVGFKPRECASRLPAPTPSTHGSPVPLPTPRVSRPPSRAGRIDRPPEARPACAALRRPREVRANRRSAITRSAPPRRNGCRSPAAPALRRMRLCRPQAFDKLG